MAYFPRDLFYDVSHYLSAEDLAAARVTCQSFRSHVSSLVDRIQVHLQSDGPRWSKALHDAVAAFPNTTQLHLLCSDGSNSELHDLLCALTELLSARLQVLRLEAPKTTPFHWSELGVLGGLLKLTSLEISGVRGDLQPESELNPFEGLTSLTRLHLASCWPRVPITSLLCVGSLQELKFTCDLWNDAELVTLSQLTSLTNLHLQGAQMSHQVQRTTLQALAELPRLQHLQLGTLRPYQVYGVLSSSSSVRRLGLTVEGDATETLRLVHLCSPANMCNLQLTIKGVLSDAFWPAVAKLTKLQSLELTLRSYCRAAGAAQNLPSHPISALSSLLGLQVLAVTSKFKGELQQAVLGSEAAQVVVSCSSLQSLRMDCLDTEDASSCVHSLKLATCLKSLHLSCVQGKVVTHNVQAVPAVAAVQVAAIAAPVAAQAAPAAAAAEGAAARTGSDARGEVQSCTVFSLQHLPPNIEDLSLHSCESFFVHLHDGAVDAAADSKPMYLPRLHRLQVSGYFLDSAAVSCIAKSMPALQELVLVEPNLNSLAKAFAQSAGQAGSNSDANNAAGNESDSSGEAGNITWQPAPVRLDAFLTLSQLSHLHLEQSNVLLAQEAVAWLAKQQWKNLFVSAMVANGPDCEKLSALSSKSCQLNLIPRGVLSASAPMVANMHR